MTDFKCPYCSPGLQAELYKLLFIDEMVAQGIVEWLRPGNHLPKREWMPCLRLDTIEPRIKHLTHSGFRSVSTSQMLAPLFLLNAMYLLCLKVAFKYSIKILS